MEGNQNLVFTFLPLKGSVSTNFEEIARTVYRNMYANEITHRPQLKFMDQVCILNTWHLINGAISCGLTKYKSPFLQEI